MKKTTSIFFLMALSLYSLFTLSSCNSEGDERVPDNGVKMVDGSGNSYATVTIGRLTITTEDLHTTKYNHGTDVPFVAAGGNWYLSTPAYCYYDNDSQKGVLYNYFAVETDSLIPVGWHSVTGEEWNYIDSIGRAQFDNVYAKAMCSTTGWQASEIAGTPGNNPSTNNAWGLNAKPNGYRDAGGTFNQIGYKAFYWGGVWALMPSFGLTYNLDNQTTTLTMSGASKSMGVSIRCVKDY